MEFFKKLRKKDGPESEEEKLYKTLMTDSYRTNSYRRENLGENMESISTLVIDYWKQRYLLDHERKIALEIMNEYQLWSHFTHNDIDWDSLKNLDEEALHQARNLSAYYPSFIHNYENGVAEVSWQLIPDGRYWMDEDGYGVTSDVETPVYAMVDKNLNVLVKFRFIGNDYKQLDTMQKEAEQILTIRKS